MKIADMHRKAVESTYTDRATVTEWGKCKDKKTKLINFCEKTVLEDQPCKLSYEKLQNTAQGEAAASAGQIIKLFLSPDIRIKPGSKITVTHVGLTEEFSHSGRAGIYFSHQEIMLIPFKGWA